MSTCLAGSLGLSPVSMERFVHRGKDGRILDVDEFQVAKALLAGEVELVSQEVDSKHLFDLCLQFGHQSTAVAMMSYGVPGCVFKGPRSLPPHAAAPAGAAEDFCHSGCNCRHWVTCIACSWGVPEDEGVWMEDWDASLLDAKNAAESVAAMPLLRTLLEACRSEADCPRIVTEEAMAYLLDVAILVGDTELARCCAKRCTQFPLRRWRFQEFVRIRIKADAHPCVRAEIQEEDVLLAALAAGLALHCFSYYDDPWEPLCLSFSVSILEAIVLSGDAELWRRVQSLQLPLRLWPTQKGGGDVARFLLERSGGQVSLSLESMHRAERAGLELGSFQMRVPVLCQGCGLFAFFSRLSIQDLAILFGQSDCSRLCGEMNAEATEWTVSGSLEARPLVWEENLQCEYCGSTSWGTADIRTRFASLPERQAAAAVALRAALQTSFQRTASSSGMGLFQAMRSWARRKSVPIFLVELVLTFAAGRPSLLQALVGREGELPLGKCDPQNLQPVVEDSESVLSALG